MVKCICISPIFRLDTYFTISRRPLLKCSRGSIVVFPEYFNKIAGLLVSQHIRYLFDRIAVFFEEFVGISHFFLKVEFIDALSIYKFEISFKRTFSQ